MITERYGKYNFEIFLADSGLSNQWGYKIFWNNSNQFVISEERFSSPIKAIEAAKEHTRELNQRSATC